MKTQWKKLTQRLLSGAMALAMMCSFLPTTAFASYCGQAGCMGGDTSISNTKTFTIIVYVLEDGSYNYNEYTRIVGHVHGGTNYDVVAPTIASLGLDSSYTWAISKDNCVNPKNIQPGGAVWGAAGNQLKLFYHYKDNTPKYNHCLQFNANTTDAVGNMPAMQAVYGTTEPEIYQSIPGNTPNRSGYNFLGWGTYPGDTTANYTAGQSVLVSGTTTLYAVWELTPVTTYTVTYIDGVPDEMVFENQSYTVDEGEATPAFAGGNPTRDGYIFKGWSPEVTTIVTESATYTAQWRKEVTTWTVTYTDGVPGETVFANQVYTANEGEATPVYPNPTRDGYIFKGWSPTVTATVTADATYDAQWEKVEETYNVTYVDNTTSVAVPEDTTEYKKGDTVVVNKEARTYTDYIFAGWSYNGLVYGGTDGDNTAALVMPAEDVTFIAHWLEDKDNDGTPDIEENNLFKIVYDKNVNWAACSDTIIGNYVDAHQFATHEEEYTFTIRYDQYGDPTREDTTGTYRFVEWNTLANHTGTAYQQKDTISATLPADQTTSVTTIYAIWEGTVSFDANGGNRVVAKKVIVKDPMGTLPTPTNSNTELTFAGWYTQAEGGELVTEDTIMQHNVTLYAHWDEPVEDLTIEVTGGTHGSETKADGSLDLPVDVEGGVSKYEVTGLDGKVTVEPTTGDGTFTVTKPGEYTVTVTDSKGNTAQDSFKIVEVTFVSNGGSAVAHQLLKLDPFGGGNGGVEVTTGPVIEGPTEQLSLYPTVMRAPVKGATVKFPIATRPEDPTYADHTFIDWYEEDTFATTYDFNKQVTENITLYADWEAEETTPPATDKPEDTTPPSTSNPKPTPTKKPASTPAPVVPPVVITTATPAPTATPVAPVVAPADPEPVEPEATATPEPTATPEATVAPEATAAPTDDAKDNANIEQEEVPLAAPAQSASSWALLNLILVIATAAISLVLLVGYFLKHKQDDEDEEENNKKSGFMRVVSVVPAIVAVVLFVLTENMANPMAFIDKWTLAMVLIAIVQLAIVLKVRKDEND